MEVEAMNFMGDDSVRKRVSATTIQQKYSTALLVLPFFY